jgi:hypothetical protein
LLLLLGRPTRPVLERPNPGELGDGLLLPPVFLPPGDFGERPPFPPLPDGDREDSPSELEAPPPGFGIVISSFVGFPPLPFGPWPGLPLGDDIDDMFISASNDASGSESSSSWPRLPPDFGGLLAFNQALTSAIGQPSAGCGARNAPNVTSFNDSLITALTSSPITSLMSAIISLLQSSGSGLSGKPS